MHVNNLRTIGIVNSCERKFMVSFSGGMESGGDTTGVLALIGLIQ